LTFARPANFRTLQFIRIVTFFYRHSLRKYIVLTEIHQLGSEVHES
jgi:hypothetical protein